MAPGAERIARCRSRPLSWSCSTGCGPPATRRTSSAAACATSSWGGRRTTGTSRPTRGPSGSSSCSPRRATRTRSGPWPCRRDSGSSRSRRSGPTTSTPTSGGPHRVEFGDRVEVDLARRDFTVNAIAWGGAPGEEPRHRRSRSTAGPTRNGGSSGPSATRPSGSTRTPCGCSAPRASRPSSTSRSSRPRSRR